MTAKYWGAYNYVRVKCLTTIAQGKQGKTDLIYKMWRQFMSIANCRARVSKFRPQDKFILLLIFVQKLRMFYTFWKRVGRRRYKTMYLLFGSLQKELLRTAWSKSFSWYNWDFWPKCHSTMWGCRYTVRFRCLLAPLAST